MLSLKSGHMRSVLVREYLTCLLIHVQFIFLFLHINEALCFFSCSHIHVTIMIGATLEEKNQNWVACILWCEPSLRVIIILWALL